MPYSITTKDGITINNIPDDIDANSDVLRQRVAKIRAERDGTQQPVQEPVQEPQMEQPVQDTGILSGLKNAALEVMAGVNRGAVSLADMPADLANAVLQLSGAESRVPTIAGSELGQQATSGGFVKDPTARQILGTVGEFVAPGLPVGAIASKGKVAGEMLESAGDVVSAVPIRLKKQADAAVSAGFGEDIISDIAKTNLPTRKKINDMARIARAGLKSRTIKQSNRPSKIAGESLVDRYKHIDSVNRRSGNAIGKIAKSLEGKPIDVKGAEGAFISNLEKYGVGLVDDGKGGLKTDFTDFVLSPGDRGAIKEVVRQYSRISKGGFDAKDAHDMKKIIDRNVSFGKAKTALSDEADKLLKGFRRGLDSKLDDTFPRYDKANKVYAETREAIDNLQKAVGRNRDIGGVSGDEAMGVSLRKLMNNTQGRADLMDSLNEVESVANKFGGKFDDNLSLLTAVSEEFENKLKTGGSTAIRQQMAQAGKEAAIDTATGAPAGSLVSAGKRLIGAGQIDPNKALDSLENLIRAK